MAGGASTSRRFGRNNFKSNKKLILSVQKYIILRNVQNIIEKLIFTYINFSTSLAVTVIASYLL